MSDPPTESPAPATLYERVGGDVYFVALVDRFYAGVAGDPVLRPLYVDPDPGLAEARRSLALFLIQYWGGPTTYSDERGHPRLRMRHAPFTIGVEERDRWFRHMAAAVEAGGAGAGAGEREELLNYFASAADFMINR